MDVLPEELISMASQQTRLRCQEPQERTVNLIMALCHSMVYTATQQIPSQAQALHIQHRKLSISEA